MGEGDFVGEGELVGISADEEERRKGAVAKNGLDRERKARVELEQSEVSVLEESSSVSKSWSRVRLSGVSSLLGVTSWENMESSGELKFWRQASRRLVIRASTLGWLVFVNVRSMPEVSLVGQMGSALRIRGVRWSIDERVVLGRRSRARSWRMVRVEGMSLSGKVMSMSRGRRILVYSVISDAAYAM